MHFTVVFETPESTDASYGMVFIPCAVWVQGEREVVNLHWERPGYNRGDLEPLMRIERLQERIVDGGKVVVVCHPGGLGTDNDLGLLLEDLRREGFEPSVVDL